MALKKSVKKYTGVYYTESVVRRWRERADRCYWVNFRDAKTGKLRWERCGWASEGWTPEAAQRRRYELLEQDRVGDYKPKQERKVDHLTFGQLMEQHYLPWADENKRRARDDRSLYRTWLESRFAEKTLGEVSPLDLERLKKEMREAGKSEATVKHALCLVRQAFNNSIAWRLWTGKNPTESVRFPKPNNARLRYLTHEEAESLLKALADRSPQLARIATVSLYTGLRLGEVFSLKWSQVNLQQGFLTVVDSKNDETKHVFISPPLRKAIKEIPEGEPEEPLFKTRQGKPVIWLSKVFSDVVKKLGLNNGVSDRRQRVTFHTLRHTFASWAVINGVSLYVVGKALNHKTPLMTQRYSHLSPESQRTAFEAVSEFGLRSGRAVEKEADVEMMS